MGSHQSQIQLIAENTPIIYIHHNQNFLEFTLFIQKLHHIPKAYKLLSATEFCYANFKAKAQQKSQMINRYGL